MVARANPKGSSSNTHAEPKTSDDRSLSESQRPRPMARRPLPADITVEHGPANLLGRFFLKADTAARERGVHLSFGSFDELVETNARHLDTWHPLIPLFDPKYGRLLPQSSCCIIGRDRAGDVVATQAVRLYSWSDTNFFEEARSLRLFYDDPERSKRPSERCDITAQSTKLVSGAVAYSGGGWYRPDYRGRMLSAILPRISRAMAFTRWGTDYTVSIMAEKVVQGGMARRCGYTNVDWEINMVDSPVGTVRCAFVWMPRGQLLDDLGDFLRHFDSQVDRRVDQRRA
jgi:predicted nucleic acid-binding Zn ribbon protein